MIAPVTALIGADIFDGNARHAGHALVLEGARVQAIVPEDNLSTTADVIRLGGGTLCPGFVDLQVNGGGGLMFNDDQSVSALRTIAQAHARLGATSILPTLITDTPTHTQRAIDAVEAAMAAGVEGIIGLHLEGPHLSIARKGAHDPALIRPMDDADLALLLEAADRLPILKITLAPEAVSPDQVGALRRAGIIISLGHTDADFATCKAASEAGATCATHLFNAMSPLTSREPGLVGAALTLGRLSAGLIADGIHVHPATIRAALAAKEGPGRVFLVSDAMAVAGSDVTEFTLNNRRILRSDGRLTLEDGTLAGADLDLSTALQNLIDWGAATAEEALAMATSIPADLCGADVGRLKPGARADVVHLPHDRQVPLRVWQSGRPIA